MNIKLPAVVIAGLYKDSLVLTGEELHKKEQLPQFTNKSSKDIETHPPLSKKWFLGDNKKNILILLKDASAVHINEEWLTTLTKLLTACKLNIGDIAIVNHSQHGKNFTELKESLQSQVVLMFDVTTSEIQLPFAIPHYQVQKYGGCSFMTAPSITLTTDNSDATKTEKRKLWEKLKMIFNV